MSTAYVHGYDPRETERLRDQADTLVDLLHRNTVYPPGHRVLEAGCGVGAQTVTLARQSPYAEIVAVDISAASVAEAERRVRAAGHTNVAFQQADLFALPFEPDSFDHAFVCFVLEHVAEPARALAEVMRRVRPGGTVTVIEGDHGSAYFHPDHADARATVQCLVDLQREAGGDANIGRRIYPLMAEAVLADVRVSPRMVYADASRPGLVEGFIRRTFTPMVEGVRAPALAAGLMSPQAFDDGIRALYRTAEPDGTFSYTFFKGVGVRGGAS
ncbi:MAG: methyltransferase domain-containing protein [Bacteroidota bacterium]